MYSWFPSAVRNSPVETSRNVIPLVFLPKNTAAKKLLDFDCKMSSLKETPGVTNSVTPRFTMVFVIFGSSN